MFTFMYLLNHDEIREVEEYKIVKCGDLIIYGYFLIKFGAREYGLYPLPGKEEESRGFGYEFVSYWLEVLLKGYILVQGKGYVALHDYDGCSRWIEWVKEGEFVRVSLKDGRNRNARFSSEEFVITSPTVEFSKIHWEDELVPLKEIRTELLQKGREFLKEVENINPLIVSTQSLLRIKNYLEQLS